MHAYFHTGMFYNYCAVSCDNFFETEKLGTRSERIFLEILIITLISLVFDISSVAAIYYKESCPGLLVLVISKTYLISLIILAFVSRIYVLSDVNYVAVDGKKAYS